MKRIALLITIFTLTFLPGTTSAYNSNICKSSTGCTESEVGVFMAGVSQGCGNLGDCTLDDIMLLFINTGNYVVGIIGAVVLLMYVVGGFYWLASAGRKEWVDKGKKFMTISTVGLLIVMFSYLGIYALKGTLQYGNVYMSDTDEYVACSGIDTYGLPCDLNSTCTVNGCESLCRQNHPSYTEQEEGIFTVLQYYQCVDTGTNGMSSSDEGGTVYPWYNEGTCQSNLCPGGNEVRCCQVEFLY